MTKERRIIDRGFEAVVTFFGGDKVPKGVTELYKLMTADHKPIEAVNMFKELKWETSYDNHAMKILAWLIIDDMYPNWRDHVSEEPDLLTSTRELLGVTTRPNIVKSLVVMAAAKYYSEEVPLRSMLMEEAYKLIDTTESAAPSTRFAAMKIATMVGF